MNQRKAVSADPSLKVCKSKIGAIGDAMYAIGGKWTLRVVLAMMEGHRRFNELQRAVEGISAKVLSGELRDLELNGFVTRNVHTGPPVVVDYELTAYSHTLRPVLDTLSTWGAAHRETIRRGTKPPAA